MSRRLVTTLGLSFQTTKKEKGKKVEFLDLRIIMDDSSDEYNPDDKDRIRLRLESAPSGTTALRAQRSSSLHESRSRLSALLKKDVKLRRELHDDNITNNNRKSQYNQYSSATAGDNDSDVSVIEDDTKENRNLIKKQREAALDSESSEQLSTTYRTHNRIMNVRTPSRRKFLLATTRQRQKIGNNTNISSSNNPRIGREGRTTTVFGNKNATMGYGTIDDTEEATLNTHGERISKFMEAFTNSHDDISLMQAIDNINPEMMQLAMVELQLWLFDDTDGIVWSRRRDGVHVRLNGSALIDTFGLPEECSDDLCVHTQYGYGHPLWQPIANAMSSLRMSSESGLAFRSGWRFLHIMGMPDLVTKRFRGVFVVAEVSAADFAVTRLKNAFALQMLSQMSYGITYRMRFNRDREAREYATSMYKRAELVRKIASADKLIMSRREPNSILTTLVRSGVEACDAIGGWCVVRRTDLQAQIAESSVGLSVTSFKSDNLDTQFIHGEEKPALSSVTLNAHLGNSLIPETQIDGYLKELGMVTENSSKRLKALVVLPVSLRPNDSDSAGDPKCVFILACSSTEHGNLLLQEAGRLSSAASHAFAEVYRRNQMLKLDTIGGSLDRLSSIHSVPLQKGNAHENWPILTFCETIQDSGFTSTCGASTGTLLVSASILQAIHVGRESEDMKLWYDYQSVNGFRSVLSEKNDVSYGKATWTHLIDGEMVHAIEVNHASESSLHSYLLSKDQEVGSALVIPLHTIHGDALLIFTGKQEGTYPIMGGIRQEMLSPHYSGTDAALFNAVSLGHRLSMLLESAISLQCTINEMVDIKNNSTRLTRQCLAGDKLLTKERNRVVKFKVLREWQNAAKDSALLEGRTKDVGHREAILHLLNTSSRLSYDDSFYEGFEMHLAKMFPSYAVSVHRGEPTSLTEDGETVLADTQSHPQVKILRHSSSQLELVRPTIIGLLYQKEESYNEHQQQNVTVAYVKLTSSHNDTDEIPIKSIALLHYLCELGSALHNITQGAHRLSLPFMMEAFPAMLGRVDNSYEGLKRASSVLSVWLKAMCGAEVAILRLNPSHTDEVLVSSADFEATSQQEMVQESEDKMFRFIEDVSSTEFRDPSMSEQLIIKLRNGFHGDDSHGEIRVISPKGITLGRQAKDALNAVSFALSYALSTSSQFRQLDKAGNELRIQQQDSLLRLADAVKAADTHKLENDDLKNKVAAMIGLVLSMVKCSTEIASMSELGIVIANDVASVIGCKSAVLLLYNSRGEDAGTFTPVLSQDKTKANVAPLTPGQIHEIPALTPNFRGFQSKIVLTAASTKAPFGVILCFHENKLESEASCMHWNGLEKILSAGVSAMISTSLYRLESKSTIDEAKGFTDRLESATLEREKLSSILTSVNSELEAMRQTEIENTSIINSLRNDIANGDMQVEALTREKYDASHLHAEEINTLQIQLRQVQQALKDQSKLTEDFASSSVSKDVTTFEWLKTLSEKQRVVIHVVSQHDNGMLSTRGTLQGLVPAASEALRTGIYNQFTSFIGKREVSVLCAPNKTVYSNAPCDHACLAFVKVGNETFDEFEVAQFVAATNIVCGAEKHMASEVTTEDAIQIEKKFTLEKAKNERSNVIANAVDTLWKRGLSSRRDFIPAFEDVVSVLLTRGDDDPCNVTCRLWYPNPSAQGISATALGVHRDEIEYASKALKLSRPVRCGSYLFVPLLVRDARVAGLVRLERKLHEEGPKVTSEEDLILGSHTIFDETKDSLHRIAEVLFSEEEEEIVMDFCSRCLQTLEGVDILDNAMIGVNEAGSALRALQDNRLVLETKLSTEITNRTHLEDCLKACTEVIGWSNSERVTTAQLLDTFRRICLKVLCCEFAFIIAPVDGELQPTGVNGNSPTERFWMLEGEKDDPTPVGLHNGDLEHKVLTENRLHTLPNDNETFSGQCWSLRFLRDALSAEQSVNDEPLSLHKYAVLGVPLLFGGGSKGVITCVRCERHFSIIDKECLLYLGRVLVFCLEKSWDGESIGECRRKYFDARRNAECTQIKVDESIRMQKDVTSLSRQLADFVESSILDLRGTTLEGSTIDGLALTGEDFLLSTLKSLFGDVEIKAWGVDTSSIQSNTSKDTKLHDEIILKDALDKIPKTLLRTTGSVNACGGRVDYWVAENKVEIDNIDDKKSDTSTSSAYRYELCAIIRGMGTPLLRVRLPLPYWNDITIQLRFTLVLKFFAVSETYGVAFSRFQTMETTLKSIHNEEVTQIKRIHDATIVKESDNHRELLYRRTRGFNARSNLLRATINLCSTISAAHHGWITDEPIKFDIVSFASSLCHEYSTLCGMDLSACLSNALNSNTSNVTADGEGLRIRWLVNGASVAQYTDKSNLLHMATTTDSILVVNSITDINMSGSIGSGDKVMMNQYEGRDELGLGPALSTSDEKIDKSSVQFVEAVKTIHLRSDGVPAGTVLVPVNIPQSKWSLVLLVNPIYDENSPELASLYETLIVCLSGVRQVLLNMLANQRASADQVVAIREVFIGKSLTARERSMLAKCFAGLKTASLRTRSRKLAAMDALNRSIADRAEMMKALSLSAGSMGAGISSMWNQSSRALISMLLGHVAVKEVSLIVQSDSLEAFGTGVDGNHVQSTMEYVVRDLSMSPDTPDKDINQQSNAHNNDSKDGQYQVEGSSNYPTNRMEIRPLAAMGGNVPQLVEDILAGETVGRAYSVPVIKMIKQQQHDGDDVIDVSSSTDQHLWLLPVRSSTRCFGVLRLTFETRSAPKDDQIPWSPTSPNPSSDSNNICTPINPNHTSAYGYRTSLDLQYVEEMMLGFSAVMAPLLAAGEVVQNLKFKDAKKDELLLESDRRHVTLDTELNAAGDRVHRIMKSLDLLSKFIRVHVPMSVHNITPALHTFIKESLEGSLSTTLQRDVVLDFNHPTDGLPDHTESTTNANIPAKYPSHAIAFIELGGEIVGSVRISPLLPSSSSNNSNINVPTLSPSPLMQPYDMQPLALFIAASITGVMRECEAKQRVTDAVEGLQLMERRTEEQKLNIGQLQHSLDDRTAFAQFYENLSTVMNQSILFLCSGAAGDAVNAVSKEAKAYGNTGGSRDRARALRILLEETCRQVPNMMHGDVVCNIAIPVIVNDDDNDDRNGNIDHSNNDGRDVGKDVGGYTWFRAADGRFKEVHFPKSVNANDSSIKVVCNMVSSCLQQSEKSSVKISVTDNDREIPGEEMTTDGSPSHVVVSTYPLVVPRQELDASRGVQPQQRKNKSSSSSEDNYSKYSSVCFGALQVISTTSAPNTHRICEAISAALGCVLFEARTQYAQQCKMQEAQNYFVIASQRATEAEEHNQFLMVQNSIWQSIANVASVMALQCAEGHALEVVLLSQATRDPLQILGVQIRVIKGNTTSNSTIDDKDESLVRIEPLKAFAEHEVEIRLVPGLGAYGQLETLSTSEDLKSRYVSCGQEMLTEVLRIINDADAVCCARETLLVGMGARAKELEEELVSASNTITNYEHASRKVTAELVDVQRDVVKWRGKAARAVELYCVPAVADIVGLVQDSIQMEQKEGSYHVYNDLWRAVDGAVTRVTRGALPCHVSILVRNGAGSIPSILMFDGSRSHGIPISLPALTKERGCLYSTNVLSVMEKCYRQGGTFKSDGAAVEPDLAGIKNEILDAVKGKERSVYNISDGTIEAQSTRSLDGSDNDQIDDDRGSSDNDKDVGDQTSHDQSRIHKAIECDIGATCFSVIDAPADVSVIIRLVHPLIDESNAPSAIGNSIDFLSPVLSFTAALGNAYLTMSGGYSRAQSIVREKHGEAGDSQQKLGQLRTIVSRMRTVYRTVCRDATILFDPPIAARSITDSDNSGGTDEILAHPMTLPRDMAIHDSALKALALSRALLRSDGDALLLRDETTTPHTYRALRIGSGLMWPGVGQGEWGILTAVAGDMSLVQAAMGSIKPITVPSAMDDRRYVASLDGTVSPDAGYVAVPLRARNSRVTGALISVRIGGFTADDIMAMELVAAMASFSLYLSEGIPDKPLPETTVEGETYDYGDEEDNVEIKESTSSSRDDTVEQGDVIDASLPISIPSPALEKHVTKPVIASASPRARAQSPPSRSGSPARSSRALGQSKAKSKSPKKSTPRSSTRKS